ncbi:hypothetical protein QTP88_018464 [Uroleucon formosanum]
MEILDDPKGFRLSKVLMYIYKFILFFLIILILLKKKNVLILKLGRYYTIQFSKYLTTPSPQTYSVGAYLYSHVPPSNMDAVFVENRFMFIIIHSYGHKRRIGLANNGAGSCNLRWSCPGQFLLCVAVVLIWLPRLSSCCVDMKEDFVAASVVVKRINESISQLPDTQN